ncbi:MAG: hypothetical protein ACXVZL_13005 [Gaiellaceae bacterium]
MLWLALPVAVAALVWWWRTHAQARCRDCGSRAVFCSFPFGCAAKRQGLVESRVEDEPTELPPPEELL